MNHIHTSQVIANGLRPKHGHRHRVKENILETGGSEPEITLPETCLEIRSVWKMKKEPQQRHPQIQAILPLSLAGQQLQPHRLQTQMDHWSLPLPLVGWRQPLSLVGRWPPTTHVEREAPT